MTNNQARIVRKTSDRDWPLLALGFRPFYLGAAFFAVLALPLWLARYTGFLAASNPVSGLTWHIHEMTFGFAPAVIAGFLLTAVRNWTGVPTPTGWSLAALFLLWAAGRILMLTGPLAMTAAVDIAFLPALGIAVAIPIWKSRNRRNFKVLVIIAALAAANLIFHLANLGTISVSLLSMSYQFALDIVAILIAVMGGRVIPAFTANALPAARVRRDSRIEWIAIASLVAIAAAGVAGAWWTIPKGLLTGLFAVGALSHAIRLALWAPHRTISQPLLLMLPVAYAWLPMTLAFRMLEQLGVVSAAAGVHALTIGAMSSLMLAMMARSALGHTGRPLVAGTVEISAFSLLQLAAVVRVFAAAFPTESYLMTVWTAGIMWTIAFGIFLTAYFPVLTRQRIDGRLG